MWWYTALWRCCFNQRLPVHYGQKEKYLPSAGDLLAQVIGRGAEISVDGVNFRLPSDPTAPRPPPPTSARLRHITCLSVCLNFISATFGISSPTSPAEFSFCVLEAAPGVWVKKNKPKKNKAPENLDGESCFRRGLKVSQSPRPLPLCFIFYFCRYLLSFFLPPFSLLFCFFLFF